MNGSKVILLSFCFLLWFLAWCLRFLPRRDRSSALLKGVTTLAIAAMASGSVIAEVLLYRSLTGRLSLKDDNFFFAVMMAQGIVGMVIVFRSESALRRKERGADLDK